MSPLRFVTPAQLVICLVLFFLPWIQLSCTMPPEAMKDADKEEIDDFKKETGLDPTKPIGMVTQSGLQIATGDSSLASDFKKVEDSMKKQMGGGGGFKMDKDPTKETKETAPLLWLYPVALVAGIVFAVIPWASPARKWIALGCCLLALGVVGLQAAIGFPLDKELKKQNDQMKAMQGGMGGMFGDADGGAKGKSGGKEADIFRVTWKFPLYLSLLLLLGAAGTSLLGNPPPRRVKKKKKRRYEDEEDEEEGPLSLDDEEDDEPPPRKKGRRPRDDDDEDDDDDRRDRGKRRRRDDDD